MIDSVTPVMTVLLGTEGSFYIHSPPVSSQWHSLLSLSWQLVPPSFSPSTFNHPIFYSEPPLSHYLLLCPHSTTFSWNLTLMSGRAGFVWHVSISISCNILTSTQLLLRSPLEVLLLSVPLRGGLGYRLYGNEFDQG